LLGGAGLLLLIAFVNVSSLLAVRCGTRLHEIAVRRALGASQARINCQFATEGLVLVTAGSALGLALAFWTIRLLASLISTEQMNEMPYLLDTGLNSRVLLFAGAIAILAVVLFSFAPVLHFSVLKTFGGLAEGGRGSAGKLWRRLGSKLVVVELATAVVLLVGAGLLSKSVYQLLHVDLGMQPDHLATLQLQLPNSNFTSKQVQGIERRILNGIESVPGVESAGISTTSPVSSWSMATNIVIVGRPWNGDHNEVPERNVSAGYLKTLGATLVRGRYFTAIEDDPEKSPVTVINETFARKYFPGEDPVGKRIAYEHSREAMEVIGVVNDVKEGQLDSTNRPAIYVPFTQGWFPSFTLVVRTSQAEKSLLPVLTSTIHQIDKRLAARGAASMSDVINDSRSAYLHRSAAWLVDGFAGLALVLAVVGLYGVIAYSVSQRTREVGIRMALGADRGSVHRLILREAAWLTALGISIGLALSIAAAALVRGLLFGVQSWDLPTLTAVAAVLGSAALLASYIPARRAASVNPVEALRSE
jgi:predicted permease